MQFWDIGLPYASGISLSMYDCWEHKEISVFKERYAPVVPAHDFVVVRAKEDFLFIDCLGMKLGCGRKPIEERIRYIRESGNCTLFR